MRPGPTVHLAEHIPGARLVELASGAHVPTFDEAVMSQVATAVAEFLTGAVAHTADRRFAAVLFTDIVGSTAAQRERGDERWAELLRTHEAETRRIVEQFRGRVVEIQGDGNLLEFPVPGDALRAARAMGAAARELGIRIRAGVQARCVRPMGVCSGSA